MKLRILKTTALVLFVGATQMIRHDMSRRAQAAPANAATTNQSMLRTNGKIAFTSDRDGNLEIYVMNNDGTGQVRLTNDTAIDSRPAFSRDGRKIAFTSQPSSGASAAHIKIMNADGTDQTELTPITISTLTDPSDPWQKWENSSLSWSPDDSKIAFDDGGDIFTVNVNGSNRINLTNQVGDDLAPAWSPDGTRILFTSHRVGYLTMHTMNPDGSGVRELPSEFYSYDVAPDWSPSGDEIVFVELSEDWWPRIKIAKADGADRRLFDGTGSYSGGTRNIPKWSPDGTTIVFHNWKPATDDCEIYAKNATGGDVVQLTNTAGNNGQPTWQTLLPGGTFADFDGDARADISVFRPADRVWYLNRSTNGFAATQFGLSNDKITPADFDGDGKTDIAVFRDGTWYWLNSTNGSFNAIQFGLSSDLPVPADFTGDGRAELAVYRGGNWSWLELSNNQVGSVQFGLGNDKPVVADYDGDGRADQAVYREGVWHLNRSSQGYTAVQFGLPTDKPVPADYDSDGKTDPAVYRDGTWYLLQSTNGFTAFQFGLATDLPAPADYDGDGKTDAAVYRNGTWYLRQSSSGLSTTQFGLANDRPLPAAYVQ